MRSLTCYIATFAIIGMVIGCKPGSPTSGGSGDSIIGTWELTSVKMNGVEIPLSEM